MAELKVGLERSLEKRQVLADKLDEFEHCLAMPQWLPFEFVTPVKAEFPLPDHRSETQPGCGVTGRLSSVVPKCRRSRTGRLQRDAWTLKPPVPEFRILHGWAAGETPQ